MKEATYLPNSWQNTTDQVKKFFGWEVLTSEQAKIILTLYIRGTPVENIIEEMKK